MFILFNQKACFSSGFWSSRGQSKVDLKGNNDFSSFFRNNQLSFGNKNFAWKTSKANLSEWSQTPVKSFESLQIWSVIRTTFQGLVCPAVVENRWLTILYAKVNDSYRDNVMTCVTCCNLPPGVDGFKWDKFFNINFEQSDIWYGLERMHVFVIIKLQEALN